MFRRAKKKSFVVNQDRRLLIVNLKQARDILAANVQKNTSNPYAVLQLLTESGLESKFNIFILKLSL